jgi:hypothetical protein
VGGGRRPGHGRDARLRVGALRHLAAGHGRRVPAGGWCRCSRSGWAWCTGAPSTSRRWCGGSRCSGSRAPSSSWRLAPSRSSGCACGPRLLQWLARRRAAGCGARASTSWRTSSSGAGMRRGVRRLVGSTRTSRQSWCGSRAGSALVQGGDISRSLLVLWLAVGALLVVVLVALMAKPVLMLVDAAAGDGMRAWGARASGGRWLGLVRRLRWWAGGGSCWSAAPTCSSSAGWMAWRAQQARGRPWEWGPVQGRASVSGRCSR